MVDRSNPEGEFGEFESVRTSTVTSATATPSGSRSGTRGSAEPESGNSSRNPLLDDDYDADDDDVIEESGADDAFVAGMSCMRRTIVALTRI